MPNVYSTDRKPGISHRGMTKNVPVDPSRLWSVKANVEIDQTEAAIDWSIDRDCEGTWPANIFSTIPAIHGESLCRRHYCHLMDGN